MDNNTIMPVQHDRVTLTLPTLYIEVFFGGRRGKVNFFHSVLSEIT